MDDKSTILHDDDNGSLFPETETRRLSERFARAVPVEAVRALEHALRPEPERPALGSLSATLAARNKSHGEFDNDALASQRLKAAMRDTANWEALTEVQREALEHIATKIARILSGDPNYADHWSDIQGYARLVEERL